MKVKKYNKKQILETNGITPGIWLAAKIITWTIVILIIGGIIYLAI